MPFVIAALFGLVFAGLTATVLRSLTAAAEAYSGAYSQDTARRFEDLFLFVSPRRIAEAGWAAGVAAFLLVFLLTGSVSRPRGIALGLVLGGLAAVVAMRCPRWLVLTLQKRRCRRFNDQLVDALVGMSNSLKAGFSISQAFETVARERLNPISQEFALFLQQTRVGVGFSEALRNMEERVGSEDLSLVVRSIESARRSGGNLTEIFDNIASTIRARIRIENRVRTLTAQGRLQGVVVGAMPLVIGLALVMVDPALMLPFLHSPAGVLVLAAVILLVALGALLIRKIIHIDI